MKQRDRLLALRVRAAGQTRVNELERAYLDAYSILGRNESCCQFFAGKGAQQVPENLVLSLRLSSLDTQAWNPQLSAALIHFANRRTYS
jgi:hypothetical protein